MRPILLGANESVKKQVNQVWGNHKQKVREILDLYAVMNLQALAPGELSLLFSNAESLVFDKITGGGLQIKGTHDGHIDVDRSKAMEIITKPRGYKELMKAREEFYKYAKTEQISGGYVQTIFQVGNIGDYFELNKKGVLQFTAAHAAYLREIGNVYLRTEQGKRVHDFCSDVSALFFKYGLDKTFKLRNDNCIDGERLGTVINCCIDTIDYDTQKMNVKLPGSGLGYHKGFAFDTDKVVSALPRVDE